jgi:hypothetical protein
VRIRKICPVLPAGSAAVGVNIILGQLANLTVEDFPSGTDVLWYHKRLKGPRG